MEKIKVAMLLYTQGLEYDDRIRKEIVSITKAIPNVTFQIFAVTPTNIEKHGVTDYGVSYHIPYLKSRDKYKSGTHTFAKAYDFYKTVSPQLKDFDIIWCADIETFLFPALLPKGKPLVWDLHELPSRFMGRYIMRKIYRHLSSRCSLMYHANQSRIDYLNKLGMLAAKTPQVAIRNYPSAQLQNESTPEFDKIEEFKEWLHGRKCIYLQGVSSMIRRPVESVAAVLESEDYCGVVVGGFPVEAMREIERRYSGELIEQRIFFAGKVPQIQTKNFISQCRLGLVFYQTCSMNNTYCEPNRMFQTIMMGKPVVVGCNPPMKELVDKYKAGISLQSDGEDIAEIVAAIKEIDKNYDIYKANTEIAQESISWEAQEDTLINSFRKILK